MMDQKLELCDVYPHTVLTNVSLSMYSWWDGREHALRYTHTHMHRIVSNWINAWAEALQMQVIAYSLFHRECARWIKHLWINTYIDLNITLWIRYRLLLRFCPLPFPFTHYSIITDVSIFLHLSFSISPLFSVREKMNWTITIMHSENAARGYKLAKCKQVGSADPKCESLSREVWALKCLTA